MIFPNALKNLSPKTQIIIEFLALFFSGALITFSLAPFDIWPLAIISMLILHSALFNATPKQAMWRGLYFALGLQLSGNFWVYVSMHDHGGANVFLASLMTFALAFFLASWLMPLCYGYARFIRDKKTGLSFGFAALWIVSEWLKTSLLTGFPWLFLGYSQLHAPLHSFAPIIGTFGISFILAYTAAVISLSLHHKRLNRHIWPILALWLLPLYFSSIQWVDKKREEPYSVALLQPNILLEDKWQPNNRLPIMNYFQQTTAELKNIDLIVWPETAVPEIYNNIQDYLSYIDSIGKDNDSAIILGIASKWYEDERPIYHNSIVTLGKGSGIYHKQKLVPFGEYIPLESVLRGLIDFFNLPMSNFRPGPDRQAPLQALDLTIMPYICYEVVYPNFVAQSAGKADILLTVSNDAWFGTSIGPLQHMQMAQMRALETGRYMIRDTNNGVTAIINTNGDITAISPRFEKHILISDVYAYKGLTPVAQYGTLPVVILSMLILLCLGFWPAPNKQQST